MTQTIHNPQYFSTCVWYVILIFSTVLINYILGLLHYTQYNLKKHCIQIKICIFLVVKHSMLRPAKVLKKVPIFRWKIKQIKNTLNSSCKTFFSFYSWVSLPVIFDFKYAHELISHYFLLPLHQLPEKKMLNNFWPSSALFDQYVAFSAFQFSRN